MLCIVFGTSVMVQFGRRDLHHPVVVRIFLSRQKRRVRLFVEVAQGRKVRHACLVSACRTEQAFFGREILACKKAKRSYAYGQGMTWRFERFSQRNSIRRCDYFHRSYFSLPLTILPCLWFKSKHWEHNSSRLPYKGILLLKNGT